MKREICTYIDYMLLCALILSCDNPTLVKKQESDLATTSEMTEQYFEGILCYSPLSVSFEESISGEIIPVDMQGLSFMIETEYPEICRNVDIPVYIKLTGHLAPLPDAGSKSEMCLTINSIKEICKYKSSIAPMVGLYEGNGQELKIASDHTYTLRDKNGDISNGKWYLYSSKMMVLISKDSKTMMKINYRKRCLNSREDLPTIFTFVSSDFTNH